MTTRPAQILDLKQIRWVGFDVDGVMTDGGIIIDNNGQEYKRFHSRDGHALKMALRTDLKLAIITGRQSGIVTARAKEIGITEVFQGVTDKLAVYNEILKNHGLKPEETAYAGDDVIDLPILKRCRLPMAPSNACPEVLNEALFISPAGGGQGAVCQMIEFILKGQGLWDDLMLRYR